MSLLSRFARYFKHDIMHKGQQVFTSRRIFLRDGSEGYIEAEVIGSNTYWVTLELVDDKLVADCSCTYAEKDFCKHIFATLLTAEKRKYLSAAENDARIRMVLGYDGEVPLEVLEEPAGSRTLAEESEKRLPVPAPAWHSILQALKQATEYQQYSISRDRPKQRELTYLLPLEQSFRQGEPVLQIQCREPKKSGEWGKFKDVNLSFDNILLLSDPVDRRLCSILFGARQMEGYYAYHSERLSGSIALPKVLWELVLPDLCRTGRFFLVRQRESNQQESLAGCDLQEPWSFRIVAHQHDQGGTIQFSGFLRRGEESLPVGAPTILFSSGLLIYQQQLFLLEHSGAFPWISYFRETPFLSVSKEQAEVFLRELYSFPNLPPLELPEELRFPEKQGTPVPHLLVRRVGGMQYYYSEPLLVGTLTFDYDGSKVKQGTSGAVLISPTSKAIIRRDLPREEACTLLLEELGFHPRLCLGSTEVEFSISPKKLPGAIVRLLEEHWQIEAEGKLYRRASGLKMTVSTGIDWFDLHGEIQFGDTVASWPAVLESLRKEEKLISLEDGTIGMLPEEWLEKYGLLANLGKTEGESLRFARSQAGLLDALLSSLPQASCDELFEKVRSQLRQFEGIRPLEPPETFQGELRPYQKIGMGWFAFLRQFSLGGCLADDMGLGKTIQVLALLESRRQERVSARTKQGPAEPPGPALIVVPKSLIFNWKEEAARFTPALRVLDHTGAGRLAPGSHFEDYDLVLTTYGTLRRDALEFKDVEFDYVILDEAQAIKNSTSDSSKAARLLRGRHRLALSGTPIENHLGELWSLFEFLNPGLLGSSSAFRLLSGDSRKPDADARQLLNRALRPFILRRTKKMVATELPDKIEQTLYCEMEPAQARFYQELRDHYRAKLLGDIEKHGIAKSKIQILEALLRLRQAACHPDLVHKKNSSLPSAKMDAFLEQLREILDEGHKLLVFSQFTSFLALVRQQLDREKTEYLYLDGSTRDRGALVEKFQNDPSSRLFLISLKAGGLGLNLTAAEYVLLLDPWWNPAVETQAIDRTHRIGQTRHVFAYRLITRGTVEEKVLELQATKRDLADSIIQEDSSLIRSLQREDLELLLS